jgi:hypothetical protein
MRARIVQDARLESVTALTSTTIPSMETSKITVATNLRLNNLGSLVGERGPSLDSMKNSNAPRANPERMTIPPSVRVNIMLLCSA